MMGARLERDIGRRTFQRLGPVSRPRLFQRHPFGVRPPAIGGGAPAQHPAIAHQHGSDGGVWRHTAQTAARQRHRHAHPADVVRAAHGLTHASILLCIASATAAEIPFEAALMDADVTLSSKT